MVSIQTEKEKFSDEELEEIMDMHATKDLFSASEFRATIREYPLLVAGLVFAVGLLVGVSLCSGRKSR
jgi:hypothetical protein